MPSITKLSVSVFDPNTCATTVIEVPVTLYGGLASAKAEDDIVAFDELVGALCAHNYMERH